MQHRESDAPSEKVHYMLRTWRPQPTVFSTILQACLAGWLLIGLSIPIFIASSSVTEFWINDYGAIEQCKSVLHQSSTPCNVTFQITKPLAKPVYLLYEIKGFYQNYKKYFMSKSNFQLEGNPITSSDAAKACSPVVLNSDLLVNTSWGGYALNPSAVASPCGLVAKSFFNDTYALFYPNGSQVSINENGIAWPRDKGRKFKQQPNSSVVQWIDPQNEHFIVWMRTAGFPDFQKPWGIIQSDLAPGNYTLSITNNYAIEIYGAHKSILLTTTTTVGGKNMFLPSALLFFGVFFLLGAGVFYLRWKTTGGTFGPPQKQQ